ncbi:MAG: glycosyltransferase family 4 protein, partial [Firmicutes bacterium]|nr:glycosyltransferase family 4 protein [Bacillota bacterium]
LRGYATPALTFLIEWTLKPFSSLKPLLSGKFDLVVVGCYNEMVQLLALQYMRLVRQPFIINLDGEAFIDSSLKGWLKRMALHGATGYLTAGEASAKTLAQAIGNKAPIVPYYFSSLSLSEITSVPSSEPRLKTEILIPGQYQDYKGLDVAMDVARSLPLLHFTFVGTNTDTDRFIAEMSPLPENVTVIPFLQTNDLYERYRRATVMLLPSRRECWGLVVNEAAGFGTPIVSTYGSGAAVEFLEEEYPQYLAQPGSAESLTQALTCCLSDLEKSNAYASYLLEKSARYNIERSVEQHIKLFNMLA